MGLVCIKYPITPNELIFQVVINRCMDGSVRPVKHNNCFKGHIKRRGTWYPLFRQPLLQDSSGALERRDFIINLFTTLSI